MRIVDYNTFVNLPEGTIYAEYVQYVFFDPEVKGGVIKNEDDDIIDWFSTELVCNPDCEHNGSFDLITVCDIMRVASRLPDFDTSTRDGVFDDTREFLVYELEDIKLFRDKLNEIIKQLNIKE